MGFSTMSGIPKVTSTAHFYSNTNPLLQSRGIGGFTQPSALFGNGEQGAWWDFSDLSVMFQDSAGTVPAALESPVGKVLDKSGKNNHLVQPTAGARPTLSRRYNQLSSATRNLGAWVASLATLTGTVVGSIIEDGTINVHQASSGFTPAAVANTSYTCTVDLYPGARQWAYVAHYDGTTERGAYFNPSTNAVGTLIGGAVGSCTSFVDPILGKGIRAKIVITTGVIGAGPTFAVRTATADGTNNYQGVAGTVGLSFSRPDVRLTADANLAMPEYQYVDSSTVYDTLGFPAYLLFDGATKWMQSVGAIAWTGNYITGIAGVTNLSNIDQRIYQSGPNYTSTDGTFALAPINNYYSGLRLTVAFEASFTSTTYSPPETAVIGHAIDISQATQFTRSIIYRNNTANALSFSAGPTTAGPLTTQTAYVGASGGTGSFFNGRMYGLILRNALTNANDLSMTNKWMGSKCGLFF